MNRTKLLISIDKNNFSDINISDKNSIAARLRRAAIHIVPNGWKLYSMPCSTILFATFMKPAILAPFI